MRVSHAMAAYWCDELFQLVGSVVVVSAAVVTGDEKGRRAKEKGKEKQ
jgi:hypothetical protein